jgi:outer membrane biosynthesis protein TonB
LVGDQTEPPSMVEPLELPDDEPELEPLELADPEDEPELEPLEPPDDDPEPEPEPEPDPDPDPDPEPEPEPDPEPDPEPEPEPDPASAPMSSPGPVLAPEHALPMNAAAPRTRSLRRRGVNGGIHALSATRIPPGRGRARSRPSHICAPRRADGPRKLSLLSPRASLFGDTVSTEVVTDAIPGGYLCGAKDACHVGMRTE